MYVGPLLDIGYQIKYFRHVCRSPVGYWIPDKGLKAYLGLGLGLGLGLLGHSITRINILSLPFKGVDIKLGFGHIAHSTQFLPSHHCIGSSRTPI